jgi:alanyl-tRNA synthetase
LEGIIDFIMTTAKQLRKKYINFFKLDPRNHVEIAPAPLVLENDPTTLFTSAGMQPLVPYLMGRPHPKGKRLVDSQPSIRLGDIEEVGDNRHTTFFEMLGNWSLGDYFKEEQLSWIFEFFTKELGLPKQRLWVTVFEGDSQVPRDQESFEIWKKIGIPESRIIFYPASKNWWSMTGSPSEMQVGHIGGPDSEVFFDFGEDMGFHEKSNLSGMKCHPNCDCGRFLEIGNSVFIQYIKISEGQLKELPQKNVDFGGGLERILASVDNTPDVFSTDSFKEIIGELEERFRVKYGKDESIDRSLRIIADHARASTALISCGITPSNKAHGYVLRRLIRRSIVHAKRLSDQIFMPFVDLWSCGVPISRVDREYVKKVLDEEIEKFERVLETGMKKISTIIKNKERISGKVAFDLYQSEGFPIELTLEILRDHGVELSQKDKALFQEEFEKHKERSRTTSAGIFKGGLADDSSQTIRLHTATHLLLASLRKVVGDHVVQKGQNITRERSRFDFPNPEKLTDEQLRKVEEMVNKAIEEDLPVEYQVMPINDALSSGAIHAFDERYGDTVKVYFIGRSWKDAFSREFCGGPHVKSTGEIGRVRIKKQEKIGLGLVRIYLAFDK